MSRVWKRISNRGPRIPCNNEAVFLVGKVWRQDVGCSGALRCGRRRAHSNHPKRMSDISSSLAIVRLGSVSEAVLLNQEPNISVRRSIDQYKKPKPSSKKGIGHGAHAASPRLCYTVSNTLNTVLQLRPRLSGWLPDG